MRKTLKRFAATLAACTMAFALVGSMIPSTAGATAISKKAKKAAKADFDPDGTYHVYFGMQQTQSWIFRNEWYDDVLGKEGTDLKKNDVTYDQGLLRSKDGVTAIDGTSVIDAEITGNGTYTIGVEGLNGCLNEMTGEDVKISMIYATTDIPMSAKDNPVTITDWKLSLDGNDSPLPAEVFFPKEYTDASGFIRFDAVNTYQTDKGMYADGPTVMPPRDSIKLTFTVSGFNSDNPDAVEQAEEPAAGEDGSAGSSAGSSASSSESSGGSSAMPVVIVIVVIVIVAVVAVVVVKKKKE